MGLGKWLNDFSPCDHLINDKVGNRSIPYDLIFQQAASLIGSERIVPEKRENRDMMLWDEFKYPVLLFFG